MTNMGRTKIRLPTYLKNYNQRLKPLKPIAASAAVATKPETKGRKERKERMMNRRGRTKVRTKVGRKEGCWNDG